MENSLKRVKRKKENILAKEQSHVNKKQFNRPGPQLEWEFPGDNLLPTCGQILTRVMESPGMKDHRQQ